MTIDSFGIDDRNSKYFCQHMADLTYVSPCFIVTDVKPSVDFYVDKLGFEVRYIAPEDSPFFAMVGRGWTPLFTWTTPMVCSRSLGPAA